MLSCALDLHEDDVSIVSEQDACDQTKHPASDTSAILGSSDDTDQRSDNVQDGSDTSTEKITPDPVDHLDLLVQLHHEDGEEDHGEDHLADGHSRVASICRGGIADEDD